MTFALSALLLAAAPAPAVDEHIDHAEAEARIMACGFEQVEVTYQDDLQSDFIQISDPEISDDQLACAAQAMDMTYYFIAVPPEYGIAFASHEREIARPRTVAMVIEWLDEQGMSTDFPVYDPETISAEEFADRLEQFCGPEAADMLGSNYGPNTLDPENYIGMINNQAKARASLCLMLPGEVARFPIGFIGNEKTAEKPMAD